MPVCSHECTKEKSKTSLKAGFCDYALTASFDLAREFLSILGNVEAVEVTFGCTPQTEIVHSQG